MLIKSRLFGFLISTLLIVAMATGCSGGNKNMEVVIYTNADQEAVEAMTKALDANGFENKYLLQSFGSSELGGRMFAEGKSLEADLLVMSSFYIESAQEQHDMFTDLTFTTAALGSDNDCQNISQ